MTDRRARSVWLATSATMFVGLGIATLASCSDRVAPIAPAVVEQVPETTVMPPMHRHHHGGLSGGGHG